MMFEQKSKQFKKFETIHQLFEFVYNKTANNREL